MKQSNKKKRTTFQFLDRIELIHLNFKKFFFLLLARLIVQVNFFFFFSLKQFFAKLFRPGIEVENFITK